MSSIDGIVFFFAILICICFNILNKLGTCKVLILIIFKYFFVCLNVYIALFSFHFFATVLTTEPSGTWD